MVMGDDEDDEDGVRITGFEEHLLRKKSLYDGGGCVLNKAFQFFDYCF